MSEIPDPAKKAVEEPENLEKHLQDLLLYHSGR